MHEKVIGKFVALLGLLYHEAVDEIFLNKQLISFTQVKIDGERRSDAQDLVSRRRRKKKEGRGTDQYLGCFSSSLSHREST
jgi:hypothetical protein